MSSSNTLIPQGPNSLRAELYELLHEGVVKVRFTKVNGELRLMKCTLDPAVLPPHETNTDLPIDFPKPINENLDVLRVWDVEAEGWRSFRLDSIIGYTYTKRKST